MTADLTTPMPDTTLPCDPNGRTRAASGTCVCGAEVQLGWDAYLDDDGCIVGCDECGFTGGKVAGFVGETRKFTLGLHPTQHKPVVYLIWTVYPDDRPPGLTCVSLTPRHRDYAISAFRRSAPIGARVVAEEVIAEHFGGVGGVYALWADFASDLRFRSKAGRYVMLEMAKLPSDGG